MNNVPNNEKEQTTAERSAELQDAADTLEGIGHDPDHGLTADAAGSKPDVKKPVEDDQKLTVERLDDLGIQQRVG